MKLKLQPQPKKELTHIACGTALCTAVMWVVFAEMLPHAAARRDGALAAAVGYLVMMALDIALG